MRSQLASAATLMPGAVASGLIIINMISDEFSRFIPVSAFL
jgi:hypothetical protein